MRSWKVLAVVVQGGKEREKHSAREREKKTRGREKGKGKGNTGGKEGGKGGAETQGTYLQIGLYELSARPGLALLKYRELS